MTPASYPTAPMQSHSFADEQEAPWTHVKSFPTFPTFLEQLWYRVSHALFYLYKESGKRITPDIEEATCSLLLDTLRGTHFDDRADLIMGECCHELSLEALPDRVQRLHQLVHTMLLLTTIISTKQGKKRLSIFVDIADTLQPEEQLSWAIVSHAFEDTVPDPQYDPILECLAAALPDYSAEDLDFILGPQWCVPAQLCTRTLLKMQGLKIKLLDQSDECLTAIKKLRVNRDILMDLWQHKKLEDPFEDNNKADDCENFESFPTDDQEGCYVERVVLGQVEGTTVKSAACDDDSEAEDDELAVDWSAYTMGLVQSSGDCSGLCRLVDGPCSC